MMLLILLRNSVTFKITKYKYMSVTGLFLKFGLCVTRVAFCLAVANSRTVTVFLRL
jgi:hypothetical protein